MPCSREFVYERIVIAIRHVVEILHAYDLRDSLRFLQLPCSYVAQSDVTNQSPPLQLHQHSQWCLDRSFRWRGDSTHSKVDDVEPFDAEVPKIVMNAVEQFVARKCLIP